MPGIPTLSLEQATKRQPRTVIRTLGRNGSASEYILCSAVLILAESQPYKADADTIKFEAAIRSVPPPPGMVVREAVQRHCI